jgi:hypothetical protein
LLIVSKVKAHVDECRDARSASESILGRWRPLTSVALTLQRTSAIDAGDVEVLHLEPLFDAASRPLTTDA